ncbi:WD40 repeat-like protein [Hortaea werneckii]|nr:WD40 repeat-like protein [Hortaea werneckii]
MQGLHWQLLGPSRECALAARASMHAMQHHVGLVQGLQYGSGTQAPAYRFRNFTTKHQARFSHYQLRNVLAATSRSDIFYADESKVYRTALAGVRTQDTVMDFSKANLPNAAFRITCLSASSRHKILLAGGFNGEFAMLSSFPGAHSPALTKGYLTRAFNGLVTHIQTFDDRRSGLPQAAFCSNDQHVRLMDLSTARLVHSHAYSHPVNCSATAPDGRLRVLVGDSNDAHVTDAERGNIIATLHGHTDHGFACSWAQNGLHLATGAQDGNTLVWDARNWSSPLHTLPSTMSCPRSLHFADNDGLIVAEDEDIVSVYDPSTFAKRQDIRFFGSIAGVALLDGGTELVLANSDKTVGGLMSFQRTARGHGQGQRLSRFGKGVRQSSADDPCRSLDLLSNLMV